MQNTVTHTAGLTATRKFVVKQRNLPYSNNFVQVGEAKVEGTNVYVLVQCTEDSAEPSRLYACIYSLSGILQDCASVN